MNIDTLKHSSGQAAVKLVNITKEYPRSQAQALRGVSATFTEGTFTAIMGPSGSGKSTLLQCAALLDKPTGGETWLGSKDMSMITEPELTLVRRQSIGFVFQSFNLLDTLSIWDNVLLPQKLNKQKPDATWAKEILQRVGLSGREHDYPSRLSGGQRQRVALARALAAKPRIIFADEPTGALDQRAGAEVLTLLRQAVDELHITVIMVTHDPRAAARSDRVLFLRDGQLDGELLSPTIQKVTARLAELER